MSSLSLLRAGCLVSVMIGITPLFTGTVTAQAQTAAAVANKLQIDTDQTLESADDTAASAGIKKDTPGDAGIVLKTLNTRDEMLAEQVEFLDELLRFDQRVTVLSEVEEGPLFDPDTQEIWMPGSFADIISGYFEDEEAPVADVYLHTLVHEVGHVLFSQYDLPLLAREEDAADALASVLILEYVENGADVVLNAADMFGLESEDSEWFYQSDFWSEHSLDIQRYYTALCHVYGSDPDAHDSLVNDEYGLSAERAEVCEYEYERIRRGWLAVLSPYLKR
ncbi:MAG: DUF4344 domain-containing metallopeptidase [Granulosicoccus sp.]